ncbi:MAG: transcriptional regulator [Sphingomonadales bacterium 32-64-17]|nr:MAG: transcriptional regulator [Sphingomonadales bacterium 32-64-17]
MITAQQIRAARALLGIDQKQLAELAGVSLPTIQRMEASEGQVRGTVDTLVKVIGGLEKAGIEIIGEHSPSAGIGRGVRLRETMAGASSGADASLLYDKQAPQPTPAPSPAPSGNPRHE